MSTQDESVGSTAPRHEPSGGRARRRPPCRDFGGDPRSQELARRIVERSAQISMLHRAQLADVAEFDRVEAWRGDGALSMVAWVTARCGVGTATAKQWVSAAAHLESLPCLAEGLASGDLSLDLVAPLAEVASPESDPALRAASAHWSVRQARELVAWHRAQREERARAGRDEVTTDGDGAEGLGTAGREFVHRTLRFNDRRHAVWVAFTRDDYAVAKSALVDRVKVDKLEGTPSSSADPTAYVPYDKRLYDALMHLFHAGSTSADDPGTGSANRRGRRFRPRVVVHAPLGALLGTADGDVAELSDVGPIGVDVARRLACDADVVLSVEAADGSVLDQGRARREPTVAQRVEIERRDKGCRFPGCLFREFTDVHHVEHWVEGGVTSLYNLVTLCDRHHRAVHELGWAVHGDANAALTFTSPHGRAATSVPSPTWSRSGVARPGSPGRPTPPMRC